MRIEVDARRVALLARPGLARERLSKVLDEAGALCVLAADPTELNPAALLELGPEVVVVALDLLIEDVLEQFDAVLGDPSVEVIYEEAEQAANREGWDAARWQRHLVAKLQGHANVLPPGRDPHAAATDADWLAASTITPELGRIDAPSADAFDPVSAEIDGFDGNVDFDPSLFPVQMDGGSSSIGAAEESFESFQVGTPGLNDALADFDFSVGVAADDSFAGEGAGDAPGDAGFGDFDPVNAGSADRASAALELDIGSALSGGLAVGEFVPRRELSLLDDGVEISGPPLERASGHVMAQLQARISTLELVDEQSPQAREQSGAVLILSGLGGPDAVRQLLGALSEDLARPVLVQQRLDGGRYDRLVTQLQRATKLPVQLAESGQLAGAGMVYIIPETIGLRKGDFGLRFSSDPSDSPLAALPSADSAVLLLSGSDPGHVDAAMDHRQAGALVAGQAADGCYDPVASNALAARGGDVASPAALALRLSARWSNQVSSNVQV